MNLCSNLLTVSDGRTDEDGSTNDASSVKKFKESKNEPVNEILVC